MRPSRTRAAWLALCALLAACGRGADRDPRPLVLVSVPPQAHFVERIAGDRVRVQVMIPPGASPASYEPTIGQLEALAEADLYVKVGHPSFPFERAWLDRLLDETPELPVVDSWTATGRRGEDPHLWLSPRDARETVRAIGDALAELLPDERPALAATRDALLADIDALDAQIAARLAERRGATFVVSHPAWTRFAADYGLVQLAIEGYAHEPDPRRLAQVIERARAAGISVVFAQPQFDPAHAAVVASEIGARVESLDPLRADWFDNLRHVADRLAEAAR